MLIKGIISSVNIADNTAELILPEYDNVVTSKTPFYQKNRAQTVSIGECVIIAIFNDDFTDMIII